MKTKLLNALKYIATYLINAVLIAVLLLAFLWVFPKVLPVLNSRPLAQATPTLVSINSNTPVPLNYNDALHTYELVATTAIQSSERTLNLMVAMFTAIIGLAALAAGAASFLYKTAREAEEKAKSAEISAQSAKSSAESANYLIEKLY